MRSRQHEEDSSQQKDLTNLIQAALQRGGNTNYVEKVKFAFQSSFLTLPLLFFNASFIFQYYRDQLETGMLNNPYYNGFFHNLIKTLALEGGIISAEAISITTTSVVIANLITIPTALIQLRRYFKHRNDLDSLVKLLKENNCPQADQLRLYPLTRHQQEYIRSTIGSGTLNERTIIAGKSSRFQLFLDDLIWFNGETSKYISPFLVLSLLPGLVFMNRAAADLSDDLNCGPLPILGVFFDICSPIERVELMSLLAYAWGSFSGSYLLMHSLALTSRVLLTPFPEFRHFFNENINLPFKYWCEENQYEQLFKKIFLALCMPPATAYSLYRSLQFTNAYLNQMGCSASEAFSRGFFSGPSYPCSTTQASLGVSVFIGAFEFEHLYPIYMGIVTFSFLFAFWIKNQRHFDSIFIIDAIQELLDRLAIQENKLLKGLGMGALTGGIVGLWPALHMSSTILRKEGVEIFFPLNNFPSLNQSMWPDLLPVKNQPDFNSLISHIPECTISAPIGLPPVENGNNSFPGFNISVPCIEIFFDETSNQTILGLQITHPCPEHTPYSVYAATLFHLPLDCDSILLARSMAGFVAPFWLSVNIFGGLGLSLASVWLLFFFPSPSLSRYCKCNRPSRTF